MAIYHLSSGFVSRSTGRSAVQSAAYITGEKLYESRRDLTVDYQNRQHDIAHTATLIPEYLGSLSPEKRAEFSTLTIWDKLESFEDEYAKKRFPHNLEAREKYLSSAQTAMTLVMALPKELSMDTCKELVEDFAKTRFVARGLITTVAIHDDEGNPHAHVQVARRAIDENGNIAWAKDRQICTRSELIATRKLWADLANQYLERDGFDARITEKSFADLGVNLSPTKHRGWYADKLQAEQNIPSRIMRENQKAFEENRQRLCENPATILDEITSTQATFTQIQLLKSLQKRIGDDAPLVAALFEQALSASLVVGEGIDGQVRYTSASYKAIEEKACAQLEDLLQPHGGTTNRINPGHVQSLINNKYAYLSAEQKHAVLGLTKEEDQFSVMIGRAGAGKTTTLKAVAEVYQKAGYQLIGTSLSALAAENLENETGVKSSTMDSLLYIWGRYQQAKDQFLSFNAIMEEGAFKQLKWYQDLTRFESRKLTDKHVIIVDEAGMIGTKKWQELLTHAKRAGAKVIAVGDDHQFKAIEAGDFFRDMVNRAGEKEKLYTLDTIRRQRVDWMVEASKSFAELHTQKALSLYEQHGHVHQVDRLSLEADMAKDYVSRIARSQEKGSESKQSDGLVLAFTHAQTRELNEAIRRELKAQGKLPKETLLKLGNQAFSQGDKIVFLKNNKQNVVILNHQGKPIPRAFIKNGTTGFLESISKKGEVTVRLSDNQKAVFHKESYKAIDYGYALTTHKSQGQTVDFTLIAASKHMDAKGLYVAMTRHRHDVQLYYGKEDFRTFAHLTHHLSRFESKDLVKDYTIRPENEAAWQRVQEYRACILDAAAILKEGQTIGQVDFQAYHAIKQDQIALGKEILSNFNGHKLYLEQAGLTQEMLQITTGQKQRPLSLMEEKAKLTVEIYGETSHLARSLLTKLRSQTLTPNPRNLTLEAYQQTYQQWQDLRLERDALAREILDNYPLYRPFVNEFSKTYGINKKILMSQVKYRERMQEEARIKDLSRENAALIQRETSLDIRDNIRENTSVITHQKENGNRNYVKYRNNQEDNISELSKPNNETTRQDQAMKPGRHAQKFNRITEDITSSLNAHIKDLAFHFLGKPSRQTVKEWRYGHKGSIAIQVAGTKQGLYSNFETGTSGNAVKLIADQLGLSSKEAFKWGAQWLYGDERKLDHARVSSFKDLSRDPSSKLAQQKIWTPVFPVPHAKATPDLKKEPHLAPMLRGRTEVARYAYKDADGKLIGYVVRLEDKNGNKITPMLTYCQDKDGKQAWRFQGFGDLHGTGRPLYGLEQLKERRSAPILIVEGEKTAEAAKHLFKDHIVLTWSGGCGAVQKSDWSVLRGKEVTLFPDHDKPGLTAAHKIAGILLAQDQLAQSEKSDLPSPQTKTQIKIVDLPTSLPHKWDLADQMPKDFSAHDLLKQTRTITSTLDLRENEDVSFGSQNAFKTFSYQEIYQHGRNHRANHLTNQESAPFIGHIAGETYQELKQWHALTGQPYDDAKLQEQAALTGIWTEHTREFMRIINRDKSPETILKEALSIGAIAGKLHVDGYAKGRGNRDDEIFQQAKQMHQTMEKKGKNLIHNPPEILKDLPKDTQAIVIQELIRFRHVMGDAMPSQTAQDIVKTLQLHAKNDTPTRAIQGMLHLCRQGYAKELQTLPSDKALAHSTTSQTQKIEKLNNALTQSQNLALQSEKTLLLQRQMHRGFER